MVTAKKAKENLEMSFGLMLAGRDDIAQVCLDRVVEYLDSQIEKEKQNEITYNTTNNGTS